MPTNRISEVTKVKQFQLVHFRDAIKGENGEVKDREVLILYALGEDGIVYEYSGGKWLGLPVTKATVPMKDAKI